MPDDDVDEARLDEFAELAIAETSAFEEGRQDNDLLHPGIGIDTGEAGEPVVLGKCGRPKLAGAIENVEFFLRDAKIIERQWQRHGIAPKMALEIRRHPLWCMYEAVNLPRESAHRRISAGAQCLECAARHVQWLVVGEDTVGKVFGQRVPRGLFRGWNGGRRVLGQGAKERLCRVQRYTFWRIGVRVQ